MPDKVRRAVTGLGDLMDDYEFHYPQSSTPTTSTTSARRSAGTASTHRTGLHLDPRFGKGGLSSPDDAVRGRGAAGARSRRRTSPADVGAHMIIWPGIEGYNYPFQTPYAESWARFVDGDRPRRRRSAPSAA